MGTWELCKDLQASVVRTIQTSKYNGILKLEERDPELRKSTSSQASHTANTETNQLLTSLARQLAIQKAITFLIP